MAKSLDFPRRRLTPEQRGASFRAAAEAVAALCTQAASTRDFAIAAIGRACDARLTVGLKLIELKEQFAGDFDDWLEGYCGHLFHRSTAYRWIGKVRDLQVATGKPDPTFEDLKRAMLAAELLPEPCPEPGTGGEHPQPLFRLRFDLSDTAPEKWQPATRREFLERAKPVVELYERVRAAENAA